MFRLSVAALLVLLTSTKAGAQHEPGFWLDKSGTATIPSFAEGQPSAELATPWMHLPIASSIGLPIKDPMLASTQLGKGVMVNDMALAFANMKIISRDMVCAELAEGTVNAGATPVQRVVEWAKVKLNLGFMIVKGADGPYVLDQFDHKLEQACTGQITLVGLHRVANYFKFDADAKTDDELENLENPALKAELERFAKAQAQAALDVLRRTGAIVVTPSTALYFDGDKKDNRNGSVIVKEYLKILSAGIGTKKPLIVFAPVADDYAPAASGDQVVKDKPFTKYQRHIGKHFRNAADVTMPKLFWRQYSPAIEAERMTDKVKITHYDRDKNKHFWMMPQATDGLTGTKPALKDFDQGFQKCTHKMNGAFDHLHRMRAVVLYDLDEASCADLKDLKLIEFFRK